MKRIKRLGCFLFSMLLVLSCLNVTVFAGDITAEGASQDNTVIDSSISENETVDHLEENTIAGNNEEAEIGENYGMSADEESGTDMSPGLPSGEEPETQTETELPVISISELTISATDTAGTQKEYELKALNIGDDYDSLYFAVWSDNGGQDDLIWYSAEETSQGNWESEAVISRHKTSGKYNVHVYGHCSDGLVFVGSTAFTVDPVVFGTCETANYNENEGSFDVILNGIECPSGIDSLLVPIWCAEDQSDIIWYSAKNQGDGSYKVHVSIADHNYNTGYYKIHVYLNAGNGITAFTTVSNQKVDKPAVVVKAEDADGSQSIFTITVMNLGISGNYRSVCIPTWSEKGGQDDIVWYQANKQKDGSWTAAVDISRHKTAGTYYSHVYAISMDGSMNFVGSCSYAVDTPSIGTCQIVDYIQNEGCFDVVLSDVVCAASANIMVPVWSRADQSDIYWYSAVKQSDGTYRAHVSIGNHNYNIGTYIVHAYIFTSTGLTAFASAGTQEVTKPEVAIKVTDENNAQTDYTIKLLNLNMIGDYSSVVFPVWSDKNGQDDIRWYQGKHNSDGSWTATVNVADHKSSGSYNVHVYAIDAKGNMSFIDSTSFVVDGPSLGEYSIINYDRIGGSFDVVFTDVVCESGISGFYVPIWSQTDQSDIIWNVPVKQEDGSYKVSVSISDYDYNYGSYNVHAYLYAENGLTASAVIGKQEVEFPETAVTAADNTGHERIYKLTASGEGLSASVNSVSFAVWSSENGQDDIIWYSASESETDTWEVVLNINNHKDIGSYCVHTYVSLPNSRLKFIGSTSFSVSSEPFTNSDMSESDMFYYFTSKGLTEEGAAGLMGNLYWESSLFSNNLQNTSNIAFGITDAEYTSSVDDGTYRYSTYDNVRDSFSYDSSGYGLAQWTFWTRKQALYDYCKNSESSIGNAQMQCSFLIKELQEDFSGLYTTLTTTSSVSDASYEVLTKFERPANQGEAVQLQRSTRSQYYYDTYKTVE